jgi:hypothetical protein
MPPVETPEGSFAAALAEARRADAETEAGNIRDLAGRQFIEGLTGVRGQGVVKKPMNEARVMEAEQQRQAAKERWARITSEQQRGSAYEEQVRQLREGGLLRAKQIEEEIKLKRDIFNAQQAQAAAKAAQGAMPKPAKQPKQPKAPSASQSWGGSVIDSPAGEIRPGAKFSELPMQIRVKNHQDMVAKAEAWGNAINAYSDLKGKLQEFLANPNPDTKARLAGPALQAATSATSALGQGVMQDNERRAQFEALGITGTDTASWGAWIDRAMGDANAAKRFTQRLEDATARAHTALNTSARARGYDVGKSAPATVKVKVIDRDSKKFGQVIDVDDETARSLVEHGAGELQ